MAVAGGLSAPLVTYAQGSNVEIYGLLRPSINFIDNGDDTGSAMEFNNSRLGFKGTEDLGSGLKAIWQLESNVRLDQRGDGANFVNRDAWVGLAGNFGSVTIGNHQTAYRLTTAALDPFADSIGDYNNIMGVYGVAEGGENNIAAADFNQRLRNSILYTSPKIAGFQARVSYALNANEGPGGGTADDNVMAVGASWSAGALAVYGAYELQRGAGNAALGTGDTDDDGSAAKVGASFKVLPTTTIYAMVERMWVDGGIGGADFDNRDAYYIAAKHSVGNIDLLGNFMVARDSDAGDDGAKGFALGASYNFSKRTSLGLIYAQVRNDDDGRYGMDQGGYTAPDAIGGENIKGYSLRISHSF